MRSFVKQTEGAAVVDAPAPTSTQPEQTAGEPAAGVVTDTRSASTAMTIPRQSAYVEGDVDKSDIKTPYLSCVQAVGPKSLLFTPGQLVLGEVAISEPPKPQQPSAKVRVLFMRVTKTFVENLKYDPTPTAPRPRVFATAEQVRLVGGVTQWVGNTPPSFLPKTTCFALVRCPEKFEDGQFNIIAGDKAYAPAMLSFQKTSYAAAKTLWTDLSLSLKNDPTGTFYDLYWVREQRGPNFVWVAKLVRVRDEKPSDSLVAIARKLSGGSLSIEEDDTAAE